MPLLPADSRDDGEKRNPKPEPEVESRCRTRCEVPARRARQCVRKLRPNDPLRIGQTCEGIGPGKLEPIDGAGLELGRSVVKVSRYFVCDFSFA